LPSSIPNRNSEQPIRYIARDSIQLDSYKTEEEVDYTIEKIPEIVNQLCELSPFVAK
jgi:hypothetical protein